MSAQGVVQGFIRRTRFILITDYIYAANQFDLLAIGSLLFEHIIQWVCFFVLRRTLQGWSMQIS
jgi:hypothetical protein